MYLLAFIHRAFVNVAIIILPALLPHPLLLSWHIFANETEMHSKTEQKRKNTASEEKSTNKYKKIYNNNGKNTNEK